MPITKKLEEVKEFTGKLGEVIKKSQPETPQLAIENTTTHKPIENNEGVIYDVELENTLNNSGFFNIEERNAGGIFWNGFPVEKLGGNKLKINEKLYNITPGIQKILTDKSNIPLKNLKHQDGEIFIKVLESLDFENYKAIRRESKSSRYKLSKSNFKKT